MLLYKKKEDSTMENVYKRCPTFENNNYCIRKLQKEDVDGLLNIYSDKKAVPFFNADNCHGDDFYYTTTERMKQAVDFWIEAYNNGWFVRWIIIDKHSDEIVGTIEAFHRDANDYFTNSALIRIDFRSDYEKEQCIKEVFELLEIPCFDIFYCDKLVTKGFPLSPERIKALTNLGYVKSNEPLVGSYDKYYDYWVKLK